MHSAMRLLRTMIRVGDLERSLAFCTGVLGMTLLRRTDDPTGRFTLAFVGYGPESEQTVTSMTQTLSQELGGSNIRISAIAPGLVDTRVASAIVGDEDMRKHVVERTALGPHAQPDEIAGAAVFLASKASSSVTGRTVLSNWQAARHMRTVSAKPVRIAAACR